MPQLNYAISLLIVVTDIVEFLYIL